jgi:hypothetical protein
MARTGRRTRPPKRPVSDTLLEDTRSWLNAHVTFERLADTIRCPHCSSLIYRRLGPGVLCGNCGRLWVVRELLDGVAGLKGAA